MKIVHIEDFFHPDAGYQVNILSKHQVKDGHDVFVISSQMRRIPERLKSFFGYSDIPDRDASFSKRTGVNVIRVPIIKYYSGRSIYTIKMFRCVKKLAPDILFVHGNDSFAGIIYTLRSRNLNYPLIMDSHMLEMASSNTFNKIYYWAYRTFIKNKLIKSGIKVIKVQKDDFTLKNLGIPKHLTPVVLHGTDTMQFQPRPDSRRELRAKYEVGVGDFVVLYMGKLTEDKGALLLVEAFKAKFNIARNVILVIVGSVSSDYGRKIETEIDNCENKILRFPTQKYPDLPDFYHLSDVAVFPRHCSLSFYDAQACGLPVILEDNHINVERISMNNGLIFKSGDSGDLREKIESMARMNNEDFSQMQEAAKSYICSNNLGYDTISRQYDSILNESIEEFRNSRKKL